MGNAKVGGDEYTKIVRVTWTLCERSKTKFWKFFVMWILKDAHHEEGIESLGTWQQKISKVLLRVLDRRSIRSTYYDINLKTVCIFIFCLNGLIFLCLYVTKRYNQFGTSVSVDRLWDTIKYRSNIQWMNWVLSHPWVYKIQFVYLGRLLCRILVFDFNKSRYFGCNVTFDVS